MKTFSFDIKASKKVIAALGRDMADISAHFPALFTKADKICLVTGAGNPPSLEARALKLFPRGRAALHKYQLPRSEKAKTLEEAGKLCAFLFGKGFSRDSLILAAGGGAVTDLAGFAASIYMRGVNWISVPTTFLAQIDAGLGGKTGVNLAGAKNIAGTFHQPVLVVCDTAFLDSLPLSELRSGAGELVKYAMIGPAPLRRLLAADIAGAIGGDKPALTACVGACAAYKLRLAAKDERDETGLREILNFGHTAGHALEALSGGRLPHGEAVARGMRAALAASLKLRLISGPAFKKLKALLDALALPPATTVRRDFKRFTALVSKDKKARGVTNRFILLKGPGRPVPVDNMNLSVLNYIFQEALK